MALGGGSMRGETYGARLRSREQTPSQSAEKSVGRSHLESGGELKLKPQASTRSRRDGSQESVDEHGGCEAGAHDYRTPCPLPQNQEKFGREEVGAHHSQESRQKESPESCSQKECATEGAWERATA